MIKPHKKHVLVKPFEADSISEGGIIVSDAHKPDSQRVKVVAVGEGTKKEPMRLKPGETAFRIKDCGSEVEIGGEKHFIVEQSWLIAKLN